MANRAWPDERRPIMRVLPLFAAALALAAALAPRHAPAALFGDDAREERSASRAKAAKAAPDGLALRRIRRAAIGASAAGALGLAGANLELCFLPETSFMGGFGGGPGYQSYALGIKRVMGGESILPYAGAGFARWATSGQPSGPISATTPGFLADSFMSDEQKRQGLVSENMFYGDLGLQWLASSGSWAGSSIFIEAVALAEISRLRVAPTGAFGYLYYF
jgi:hypothetical protein